MNAKRNIEKKEKNKKNVALNAMKNGGASLTTTKCVEWRRQERKFEKKIVKRLHATNYKNLLKKKIKLKESAAEAEINC